MRGLNITHTNHIYLYNTKHISVLYIIEFLWYIEYNYYINNKHVHNSKR